MDEDSGIIWQACNGVGRSEWIDSKVDAEDISNSKKKLETQKFVVVLNNVQIPRLIQK